MPGRPREGFPERRQIGFGRLGTIRPFSELTANPTTNPTHMKRPTLALLALSLTFASAGAQPAEKKKDSPATVTTAKHAPADVAFVKTAAGDGMAEVKLGTLAKQRGKDGKVKEFGEQMAIDHGKANEQLKALAANKGIELSQELPKKHEAAAAKLMKLSGEEFDTAYAELMVKDHTKAVSEFEKASSSAQDSDVKAFATKTLPVLQHHLKMARELASAFTKPAAKK